MSVSGPVRSTSAEATERVGESLASRLAGGDVVLLEGDLASGKTTFVRGLVRGLGGSAEAVSSPTFVLHQSYECRARGITSLHHIDLYRLAGSRVELREIGLDEVLSEAAAVAAVEWPKGALDALTPADARVWRVEITADENGSRTITVEPPDNITRT